MSSKMLWINFISLVCIIISLYQPIIIQYHPQKQGKNKI